MQRIQAPVEIEVDMAKKDDWNITDLEEQDFPAQDGGDYEEDAWEEPGEDGREDGWDGSDEAYRDPPRDRRGGGRGENGPGKKGRIVGGILIAVGMLCLIAGAGVLVKNHLDTKRVQEQMEVLRNQVALDASRQAADEASRQAASQDGQDLSRPGQDGSEPSEPGQDPSMDQSGAEPGEDGQTGQAGEGAQASSEEPVRVPNPYGEYFLKNSDMAAWLKIDGTKIDYPVMQTMNDENYYLKRGFDKKSNQNGCLILDTDSTITGELSTNQIIHGHNMKSGEMFGTLTKYEDKKYCEEHKYIKLYTQECERNYEVIAVFRSQVYKKTDDVFKFYKFFQADTQEEFDHWYDNIKALSEFDTGVTAQFGDRFLTLSTCVYHVENGRLVVVAKEIEPGDYYEPVQ